MSYTRAMSGLQFLEQNDYNENEFVPPNLHTNWSSVRFVNCNYFVIVLSSVIAYCCQDKLAISSMIVR